MGANNLAKNRRGSRDRPIPPKTKKQIIERLGLGGGIGFSPEFDETMEEIKDTGKLPDQKTLEERFPGITASPEARREFLMLSIFALRLRGAKQYQIAQTLGVHRNVVLYYCKQMAKAFEREIDGLSFTGQMGRSVAVFRDLQAQAFALIAKTTINDQNKLRALREAAYMEHSIIRTLKEGGFFDNSRLSPKHSDTAPQTDAGLLHSLLAGMFTGDDGEEGGGEDMGEEGFVPSDEDISVLRLT